MGVAKNTRNAVVNSRPLIPLWRASAVLFTALIYVFSFPAFNFGSLVWVLFVPFFLAVPSAPWAFTWRWSFLAGVLSSMGTLYWVYPTCRWGGVPSPVAALALGTLSLYLGLFWVLFGVGVRFFARAPLWQRPFWFAALWVCVEALRGHLFGGFPWLTLACSQWLVPKHLSLAEIGGSYAVSFLIVLFNGTVAVFCQGWVASPRNRAATLPAFLSLVALTAWSVWLWRRPLPLSGKPVPIAIVQGNIDQYKKWDRAYEEEIVHAYSTLTRQAAGSKPALVVWPETAVPGWVPNEERQTRWLTDLARSSKIFLLAGAVTRETSGDFNAAFLVSDDGNILGRYRKMHLVPFGEYVPLRRWFAPFIKALNDLGSFDQGPEPTVLPVPSARLGVTICFEGLFPHLVRQFSRNGAHILINITNDGWYRDTAAPEQHFSAAVLRAVENRRWMVRAANTGYSGFISPRGEIVSRTDLLKPAILEGVSFPIETQTFYVRHGDVWVVLCALFLICGVTIFYFKNKNLENPL